VPSPALDSFIALIRSDQSLQQQVRAMSGLSELVALAQQHGHVLNPRELQLWAHSSCLPWAGHDEARKRVAFFRSA
jgi:hypothetical protein